jgi:DNA-binding response OmpR family regulator
VAVSITAQEVGTTMRILVVDDDEKITRMLHRGLTLEGHKVDVAGDGQQALRLAALTAYDLVILDVMIPSIDGIEVCRRLRVAGESRLIHTVRGVGYVLREE